MKIQTNQYYMRLSQLVLVSGATGMLSEETLRYIIRWTEDGTPMRDEVKAEELSRAPTLPELHENYMLALNVIAEQAKKIEELEAALKDMAGKRDWLKDAYDTVTGGTNPL